jgi:hypothetical protein
MIEEARLYLVELKLEPEATDDDIINEILLAFIKQQRKAREPKKCKAGVMPESTRYMGETYPAWDKANRYKEHMAKQRSKQHE